MTQGWSLVHTWRKLSPRCLLPKSIWHSSSSWMDMWEKSGRGSLVMTWSFFNLLARPAMVNSGRKLKAACEVIWSVRAYGARLFFCAIHLIQITHRVARTVDGSYFLGFIIILQRFLIINHFGLFSLYQWFFGFYLTFMGKTSLSEISWRWFNFWRLNGKMGLQEEPTVA